MSPFRLHRRAVLRGAAGVVVALPWLEIMEPLKAARAAGTPPKRYLVGYCGVSIAGDSDKDVKQFVPAMTGPNYDLPKALAPLGPSGAQPFISVVSGLRIPPNGGVAGFNRFHGGIQSALLTGTHNGYVAPGAEGDAVVMGTSSDQIVSDAWASANLKYKNLPLRVQASGYGNGAGRAHDSLNFRMEGGSQAKKLGMQGSPKAAYAGLFSNFAAPAGSGGPASSGDDDFAYRRRKSIVDFARENAKRLRTRLGAIDKARLDEHLTQIDELGKTITKAPKFVATASCAKPEAYGDDPAVGANYGGEEIRAKQMCDLMHLAFACDQTRVGTLMFSYAQSFMSMKELTGSASNLHQLSHFGGNVSSGIAWHMKHFGAFIKKLADTADEGGRLIDNCAIAFLFEGGHQPKMGGGFETHSGENMACLIAGKAGGLKTGQHIATTGTPHPANVLITVMNAAGVPTKKLGVIEGEVPGLRA